MHALPPTAIPTPRAVAWLGYGGLLPFVALAAWVQLHEPGWMPMTTGGWPAWAPVLALQAYGAVILSFVGALHWAFAMTLPGLGEGQRAWRFTWSTVPALLAWPAMVLPPRLGLPLLVAGFLLHYLQDRRLAAAQPLPSWYLPLRLRLTVVACACLLAGVWR